MRAIAVIATTFVLVDEEKGVLDMFAIRDDCIASVVANFVQPPYKMSSPWNPR
jgi:hypothetical protein